MAAQVNTEECIGCGLCVDECPVSAIAVENDVAVVSEDDCIECGACESECPNGAITVG